MHRTKLKRYGKDLAADPSKVSEEAEKQLPIRRENIRRMLQDRPQQDA